MLSNTAVVGAIVSLTVVASVVVAIVVLAKVKKQLYPEEMQELQTRTEDVRRTDDT